MAALRARCLAPSAAPEFRGMLCEHGVQTRRRLLDSLAACIHARSMASTALLSRQRQSGSGCLWLEAPSHLRTAALGLQSRATAAWALPCLPGAAPKRYRFHLISPYHLISP